MSSLRDRSLGPLLASASVVLTLAAAELGLRLAGDGWRPILHQNEPVMRESDPVLGWTSIEGRWLYPAYVQGLLPILMTVVSPGRRASGSPATGSRPALVLIGGSFTEGWAVSDPDTWAWKLGQRMPGFETVNLGMSGYGTLQSLLALERFLAARPSPALVIYGMVEHHELRNVADPAWLRLLSRHVSRRRGELALPFCRLGPDGALACEPPRADPLAWLERRSALVFRLRNAWLDRQRARLEAEAEPVTRLLLERMQRLTSEHGSRLAVVFLSMSDEKAARYRELLEQRDAEAIDCRVREMAQRRYRVPGEGHPNARLHSIWADCVAKALAGSGGTGAPHSGRHDREGLPRPVEQAEEREQGQAAALDAQRVSEQALAQSRVADRQA